MTNPHLESLDTLQHWMQQEITAPKHELLSSRSAEGWSSSPAPVEEILTSSQYLSAKERLSIYQRSYIDRLLECLHSLFPRLYHFLKEDAFDLFAIEYLKQYPSNNYSLNKLGDNFIQYLDETRLQESVDQNWSQFILDLSILDSTFNIIYNAPGSEGQSKVSSCELMQSTTSELLELTFNITRPVYFLELSHPIHKLISQPENIDSIDIDNTEKNYLLVYRHQYICKFIGLSKPELITLQSIQDGLTVDSAVRRATEFTDLTENEALAKIRTWLLLWADNNLLITADKIDSF